MNKKFRKYNWNIQIKEQKIFCDHKYLKTENLFQIIINSVRIMKRSYTLNLRDIHILNDIKKNIFEIENLICFFEKILCNYNFLRKNLYFIINSSHLHSTGLIRLIFERMQFHQKSPFLKLKILRWTYERLHSGKFDNLVPKITFLDCNRDKNISHPYLPGRQNFYNDYNKFSDKKVLNLYREEYFQKINKNFNFSNNWKNFFEDKKK